jgi:hypothetical protein
MRCLRRRMAGLGFFAVAAATAWAQTATIQVSASKVLHPVSPYLTGACLEDVNHEVYGGIYSQMIFGESFQEPATPLPLAGFTAYGGTWTPENGALSAAAGSGAKLMYNGIDLSTGVASVNLYFTSDMGGNGGMIVNVSQPGVGADAFTGYEISVAPAGYLVLGRHVQDWEPISQTTCNVPLNQWNTLTVAITNAALQIYLNGSSITSYTDTTHPLTSGQIGLRTWQQNVTFQNFSITTNGVQQAIQFVANTNSFGGGVSGMWTAWQSGSATGQFDAELTNPFVGTQSQRLTFTGGSGQTGIENQGLNRWGMFFAGGQPYEGCLWARTETPTTLFVALESGDGSTVLAEQSLSLTSNNWQKLSFNLTPSATTSGGRFSIKLKQPGTAVVGYAFLQPGP